MNDLVCLALGALLGTLGGQAPHGLDTEPRVALVPGSNETPAPGSEDDKSWLTAQAGGTGILLGGGQGQGSQTDAGPSQAGVVEPAVIHIEEWRFPRFYCGSPDVPPTPAACLNDITQVGPVLRTCVDGSQGQDPLFRRQVDAAGLAVTGWTQVDDGCPQDDAAVVLTSEEFRRLPLAASVPTFQPAGGRALVNKDLIVFTDPAPQELSTVILGAPVQVRATPVEFAWDFGDGSAPLVTTDPGRPYPDYSVAHLYASRGTFEVQLVTTWQGVYQVAGAGPWLAVAGTAQTTSAAYAVGIEEARTYLVQGSQG